MKKLATLLLLTAAFGPASFAAISADAARTKAEAVLANLKAAKAADVVKEFDANMTKALPEDQVAALWPGLEGQVGKFQSVDERRAGEFQGTMVAELFCKFEKATLILRVAFDADGKISGLYFKPVEQAILPAAK